MKQMMIALLFYFHLIGGFVLNKNGSTSAAGSSSSATNSFPDQPISDSINKSKIVVFQRTETDDAVIRLLAGKHNETKAFDDSVYDYLDLNLNDSELNFVNDTSLLAANDSDFAETTTMSKDLTLDDDETKKSTEPIFYTFRTINQTNGLGSFEDLLQLSTNQSTTNVSAERNFSYNHWQEEFKHSGYDKNIRAYHGVRPVEVQVSIHVVRVHSISESTMDFGIDIYYRENWTDPRLAYDLAVYGDELMNLPSSFVHEIWTPDTYFPNAISAVTETPGSVTHRSLLKIFPTGLIYYIRKISLTADCAMDLSLYPFDKQGCKLVICSYSFLKKDLYYKWRDGDPIDFQEKVRLPEFELKYHKPKTIDEHYYIGTYSTLHLCLVFKRSAGFCIMQVFFPATAVVMSSWVSLWMEEETQFNDVLAVIMAIIFLAFAYNSVMPKVSYVKLLDLYLGACFLFVFLSLSKLVILKYCRKSWRIKYGSTRGDNHQPADVFTQALLADEESSNVGTSDEEDDVAAQKKQLQNNNNENRKSAVNENRNSLVRFSKAKIMLQRRATLAKIALANNKKKLEAEKRFLRYLRIFHIITQLALPIGFASFFVFVLIIYPNWPRAEPC